MIRRIFWLIAAILIVGSSAAASDIRRVVTGLDERNHAVVLFELSAFQTAMTVTAQPYSLANSPYC